MKFILSAFVLVIFILLVLHLNAINANDCVYDTKSSIKFQFMHTFNESIEIFEKENRELFYSLNSTCPPSGPYKLHIKSNNRDIIEVINNSEVSLTNNEILVGKQFSVRIAGKQIGRTALHWTLSYYDKFLLQGSYSIVVVRNEMDVFLNTLFTIIISVLVMLNNINMGCQLDLEAIKRVLKKPIPPFIGFLSQFLFMPVGSYIFGLIYFSDNLAWRLGLLTLGCSPGGTGSNFWTLLFHGDVDLSVMMTFFSTVAALFMMPLWIYTLGHNLINRGNFKIPFLNLIISLIALSLPLGIGILIQKVKPEWVKVSKKIIRPFTIILLIIVVTGGLYLSWHLFKMFNWRIIAAGMSVAWGGYLFGALAAFCAKLNKKEIIAVSIETALQNPGIAFILLQLSLPQPDSDIAAVPLVGQLIMTGPPMWMFYVIYSIVRHKQRKPKNKILKIREDDNKNTEMSKEMLSSV